MQHLLLLAAVGFLGAAALRVRGETATPTAGGDRALALSSAVVPSPQPRWFSSPLIPTRPPTEAENTALQQAMALFQARQVRDDYSAVTHFLEQYSDGAWAAALETEMAKEWHRTGWYQRALATGESAWSRRLTQGSAWGATLWNHTGLRLAELYVSFGRPEPLRALLAELKPDGMTPGDRLRYRSVEHGLAMMQKRPEIAFRCGAVALDRLLASDRPDQVGHEAIQSAKAGPAGLSLGQVHELSRKVGLRLQMAFRPAGAPVVLPAVVHWKIGHFSAALEKRGELILTQSPTLWSDVWISERVWDEESTGYCLVGEGELPSGWRSVGAEEATRIVGRNGITLDQSDPNSTTRWDHQKCEEPSDRSAWPGTPPSTGMAKVNFHMMLLSQQVVDTPIGYEPPFGPPVYTTVQFTEKAYEHYGYRPQWTHNWDGSLYEDPRNPFESIWLASDGGWLNFIAADSTGKVYRGKTRNMGRLYRTSSTNMTWEFPDGTKKLYTTPFGTNVATTRTFWLTGLADASGNTVRIETTPWGRVESVSDALGRKTRFFYELGDPGQPSKPQGVPSTVNSEYTNQVTRIVDPFGRTALFEYTRTERTVSGFCNGVLCDFYYFNYDLTAITDVGGLKSQMKYDVFGAVVTELTTPYGTTKFQWGDRTQFGFRHFWVDITDPDGGTERLEYHDNAPIPQRERLGSLPQGMKANNAALEERNVFHWDKQAYALGAGALNHTNAVIYHYQYSENLEATGPVLESLKRPREARVWMNYPGQGQPWSPGTDDQPNRVGRVLDDGTTQLWQTDRDVHGNVTREVDPVGRVKEYVWSSDGVDLLEVRENRTGTPQRIYSMKYDTLHRLIEQSDAAGRTNRYSYNDRGQIVSQTNPRGEVTSYGYDTNGYLVHVDGPLSGTQDRTRFTYDPFGRTRQVITSDGFTTTYAYDSLDRWTNKAYADGTYESVTYDRLDPIVFRDRDGRVYKSEYDALQRLVRTEDPEGRVRQFEWCRCGNLSAMVDPLGRWTRWMYDVQGRLSGREYPDGSKVIYTYEQTTSRLKQVRDEQGQVMELSWGRDDRLTGKRYLQAQRPTAPVEFTYDPQWERLTGMKDGNGTTTFVYQPITPVPQANAGALVSLDGPWANDTWSWDHDVLGRLQAQSLGGATTRYVMDSPGRLLELSNTLGRFVVSWDAGTWRMTNLSLPFGGHARFQWLGGTNEARPAKTTWYTPDNNILTEWGYEYRSSGFLSRWDRLQPGLKNVWTPAYDLPGRLTRVAENTEGGASRLFEYAYDAADNRVLENIPGLRRDWQYNNLNQAVGYSGVAMPATTIEWDAESRLALIRTGERRVEVSYDGLGRRTGLRVLEGPSVLSDRRYVWKGEELAEERDASGSKVLKRYYAWGFESLNGSNWPVGRYYYIRDHLHSIRVVLDANGDVVSSFDYDPYGRRRQVTGTLVPDMGFGGYWQTATEGLLLATYRAYDPEQGRWLSRDPLREADHFNLYAYAANNPLNWEDSFGLQADITLAGVDNDLAGFGRSMNPPSGEIVVVIHGSPNGSFEITGYEKGKKGKRKPKLKKISAADLAKMIRDLSRFKDAQRIRLVSCRTAQGSFPADLARYTGKEVLAPTSKVRGNPNDGTYQLVDEKTGKPSGEWKPFAPSGRGADIPMSGKAEVEIRLE